MVEVVIAAGLLCLVLIGTVMLFNSTCRLWRIGTSGTSANMYASLAMRKIVTDIQEGQIASANGTHLIIQFPYYNTVTGAYQRNVTGQLVEYYLSGETGTEMPVEGGSNCLWRQVGGSRVRMAKELESFDFRIETSKLVRLSIKGSDSEGVQIDPDLIQQSVTLRNN